MHPVLFSTPSFVVYTYGVAMTGAVLLCLVVMSYSYPRRAMSLGDLYNFFLLIIGVLLFWQLLRTGLAHGFDWQLIRNTLRREPLGALSSYTVLPVILLVFYLYCRMRRLHYLIIMDFLLPYAILALAIQRGFGCFMAGCCHGRPTTLPWGVHFPAGSPAAETFPGMAVHPTQLYYSLTSFSIWLILLVYARHYSQRLPGEITLMGLAMLSFSYTLITFWRGDLTISLLSMTRGQIIAVFVFVMALLLLPQLKRLNQWLDNTR